MVFYEGVYIDNGDYYTNSSGQDFPKHPYDSKRFFVTQESLHCVSFDGDERRNL